MCVCVCVCVALHTAYIRKPMPRVPCTYVHSLECNTLSSCVGVYTCHVQSASSSSYPCYHGDPLLSVDIRTVPHVVH